MARKPRIKLAGTTKKEMPVLPSVQSTNITADHMGICCIVITIDYENDPAQDKAP